MASESKVEKAGTSFAYDLASHYTVASLLLLAALDLGTTYGSLMPQYNIGLGVAAFVLVLAIERKDRNPEQWKKEFFKIFVASALGAFIVMLPGSTIGLFILGIMGGLKLVSSQKT